MVDWVSSSPGAGLYLVRTPVIHTAWQEFNIRGLAGADMVSVLTANGLTLAQLQASGYLVSATLLSLSASARGYLSEWATVGAASATNPNPGDAALVGLPLGPAITLDLTRDAFKVYARASANSTEVQLILRFEVRV